MDRHVCFEEVVSSFRAQESDGLFNQIKALLGGCSADTLPIFARCKRGHGLKEKAKVLRKRPSR